MVLRTNSTVRCFLEAGSVLYREPTTKQVFSNSQLNYSFIEHILKKISVLL